MEQSDKAAKTDASQESEEIDRIMQQIEDLEKKMEQSTAASQIDAEKLNAEVSEIKSPDTASAEFASELSTDHGEEPTETPEAASDNVVALRQKNTASASSTETDSGSLVESDASPVSDQPLMQGYPSSEATGSLSLKVGGCTEVSLEFEREGIAVHLVCSQDGLTISTDHGAEFRLPFKRNAA